MNVNDLTVNFEHLKRENILADWVWLIGRKKLPILITSVGDAFLQDVDDGTIHFLDTCSAGLLKVSENLEEFRNQIKDAQFLSDYFCPQPVGVLRDSGLTLSQGQLYSLMKPSVLGGEFAPENIEMTDIEVHFSVLGQIHQQVKDLPPGTEIGSFELKPERKPWWKLWG